MTGKLAERELGEDTASSAPPRVSRWDRPPEPHDWRFFVGGLGKVLITVGLLMFGFVAYQLWGTGIETARAQNKLENQFEELVAANASNLTETTVTTAPPATTAAPATSPPTSLAPATIPPTDAVSTEPPTTPPATTAATLPPVEQDIPPIERGQVLAKLEIPRIGKVDGDALYVVPGVDLSDLKKGPGHYPDTPLPGQLGNASIAGHRTTFGEPFRHIDELEPGDEIVVTMANGDRFTYVVTSTEIVGPDDYHVVTTTDPTVAQLTLTSCHPVYTAKQRIAVHAVLQPEQSAPVGQPTYYDLEANPAAIDTEPSADDPTVTVPDVDVTEAATEADVATADDDSVDAAAATPMTSPPQIEDAFADGWFHDSGAWPQIALWAGLLIAIAFGVRWISHRFRRYSVGIAAGIIPFLICLYFFYQNVNRLLPPGF